MQARAACADGRANDALALYDGLVAELESGGEAPRILKHGAEPSLRWELRHAVADARSAGKHAVLMWSKSGDSTHLVAIPNHARALPQDDPRRRRAFNGGFIGRDGDLEIVVSWRLVKDSERGGSRGRNRRARCPPRVKRRVDAVNQIIVAKWFWQVANDSETEGLGSNIFVRLSGNQNGGNAAAKRLEAAM
jgi:hypothetical protein